MSEHIDVTVREGKLRGIVERSWLDFTFVAFRGIPYAKPPLGELRFQDPERAEPWSDIRDAAKFGNTVSKIDTFHKSPTGDEDCLYLNVYTTNIDQQSKFAVMVWIHGGALPFSSDNYDIYGPDYILSKDVLLVTINYRLGVFGFLNLGVETAPGNQGLKDALMALRWVHDNISNFGGDPENVTIFGHGFGGSVVHYLAMCPQAEGLFHKAISQSGTAACTWAFSDMCENMSLRLIMEIWGTAVTDLNEVERLLQSIDASTIVLAAERILTTHEKRQLVYPFVPSLDCNTPNPFFMEHPAEMLHRGVKVPFIIGHNSAEGTVFVRDLDDETVNQVNSDFSSIIHPNLWPILCKKSITAENIRLRYFGKKTMLIKAPARYIEFISDMHFCRGIYETACIQMHQRHRSTYMYHFAYDCKSSLLKTLLNVNIPGTTYGEELFYLFYPRMSEDVKQRYGLNVTLDSEQFDIINHFTQMWTDFAKTGNPTPAIMSSIPIKWTTLEKEDKFQILVIDKPFRREIVRSKNLRFFGVM